MNHRARASAVRSCRRISGTRRCLSTASIRARVRVRNADVPYELGFWLRGQGVRRLTLPSVSGGGLLQGQSKDYVID